MTAARLLAVIAGLGMGMPGAALGQGAGIPGTVVAQETVTCPGQSDAQLSGLAGVVRDSVANITIPSARVRASWEEDGAHRVLTAETDASGVYRLCGLPTMRPMQIQADFAGVATLPVSVTVEPGPPAGWDFRMPVRDGSVRGDPRFPGRLLGRVRDRRSRRPVEAAAVTLVGDDQQRLSSGSGRFLFEGLTPGVYRVSVEHLAFETAVQLVSVPPDLTVEVNFELSVDPIELEPLVVTAVRSKRLETRGFYDRKELGENLGIGVFITHEEIRKAGALRVTHYLARLNGVRLECTGSGNITCRIKMTGGSPSLSRRGEYGCINANVYIDGVRVIRDNQQIQESIDNFVSPTEIAAMEVYRGPSEVPAEFGGSVGRCGAIVIWTGGG